MLMASDDELAARNSLSANSLSMVYKGQTIRDGRQGTGPSPMSSLECHHKGQQKQYVGSDSRPASSDMGNKANVMLCTTKGLRTHALAL